MADPTIDETRDGARVVVYGDSAPVTAQTRRASREDRAAMAAAGVSRSLFWRRVDSGWSMHDAARTPPTPVTRYMIGGRSAVSVAIESGVGAGAFNARVRNGADIVEAATAPKQKHSKREQGLVAIAAEQGVSRPLYFARVALGWTAEKAAMTPPRAYRRAKKAGAP